MGKLTNPFAFADNFGDNPLSATIPSIVAGSIQHATFTTNGSTSRTYLADYDPGAGANRKIVAVMVIEDTSTLGRLFGSAGFGGVAMNFAGGNRYDGATNDIDAFVFYLDEADWPAPGTNAVTAAHWGMNEHASLTIFTMQDAPPGPVFWLTTNGTGTGTITLDVATPYDDMGIITALGIGQGTTDHAATGTGHAIADDYDSGATAGERVVVGYLAGGAAGAHTFGYGFTAADALGIGFGLPPIGGYTPFVIQRPVGTGVLTSGTTHNVTMPAVVNAGDLLIICASFYWLAQTSAGTITTPAGWTLPTGAKDDQNLATPGSNTIVTYVKSADGTEDGASVDLATGANATCAAYVMRIAAGGWSGTVGDIEVSTHTVGNNAEQTSHDGPAVTPSWGGAAVRWLAITAYAMADDDETIDASPVQMDAVQAQVSGAGAGAGSAVTMAWRQVIGTTYDPGGFNQVNAWHIGHTIAVKGPGD
jgi:hypothetical protein